MYDGVRFFYYDSRIQDAFSEGPGSKPGMWHYVYVQVDQEGNGELHVDCELVQTFTTTSRPEPGEDGLLTICADVQDEDLLSSHFAGIIDELVVFNTAFASTSVDYEQQTCRSTKFDPAEFESFNSPNILSAYFDFTRYDKKECIYTQEPTPAPTTPEPAPAPTLPGGGRRLLSQPSRRDGDLGLVPNRDLMVHRYNIDYATLECGYVIMPDESPYERHGRVLSPRTSPLPLRESAPWVEATALRSTMRRSNIAGGVNMTFSGANFAPSKFLSVLLGGDLGLAETIKPVPVFDEVREDDTLSILAGAVFPVPKGVCNKDHDIAQVSNFSPELGTSRLSLLYRPDMEDLVGDIAVYNSFTQARTGRNQERETASQLFSQSVSTADPSFSPSRLREYTSCLWLRLAYPSDAFTPPANKHIGGWKFVCADSNGGLWINAQRMTGAADVGFWGPLMDAYTSTGEDSRMI